MKFNDKELGAWATVFAPDKEGLLEKKGAGRGQGESVTEDRRGVRNALSNVSCWRAVGWVLSPSIFPLTDH